jgi:hypothetical protein
MRVRGGDAGAKAWGGEHRGGDQCSGQTPRSIALTAAETLRFAPGDTMRNGSIALVLCGGFGGKQPNVPLE